MSNTDLKILAKGKKVEFFVHREVLAAKSECFKSMLSTDAELEHGLRTRKISKDPLVALTLIRFCYTQEYDIATSMDSRIVDLGPVSLRYLPALKVHATVFIAADNRSLSVLADLAFEAFEQDLSGMMADASRARTAHYCWLARTLLTIMHRGASGKVLPEGKLRDRIIEAWKEEDCKLARCYTTETDFYAVLLAAPEILHELWHPTETKEVEYETLRRKYKELGRCEDDVAAFFRPMMGLHTPVE